MIYINLTDEKLKISQVYQELSSPLYGGVVVFQGSVRNIHFPDNVDPSKSVKYLDFQVYQTMAEKELKKLGQAILDKFPTVKLVSLHHKFGRCEEAEPCVFVGVASAHRSELFEACDFGIYELKKKVPIWKKEIYYDGTESGWKENCECMKSELMQ